MGIMNPPEKCHITGSPTQNNPSSMGAVEYFTDYNGEKFFFVFNQDHKNSDFVEKNKYILQGLIVNNKFPYDQTEPYYNNEKLEKIINGAVIPKTPKDKLDSLILYLFSLQENEGGSIDLKKNRRDTLLIKLYFKKHQEYWFYLSTLKDLGYITFKQIKLAQGDDTFEAELTYKGLEYIIELQEAGHKSKNCFVAISFDKTMSETRDALKNVIDKCGYKPILIDEINYDSEITINDAMISNIKSCKFLVADFTDQKHGVYFEAGYALGKNKPVIYMCSKNDFEKSHFDTNHYPHIVYDDLVDLNEKLTQKINAWIE